MEAPKEENAIDESLETRSRVSGTTHSSQSSSSSTAAVRARAKAEAARVQLSYAQKEADLLKQQAVMECEQEMEATRKKAEQLKKKAELQADLHVLRSQKAAAIALAEAQAWEASVHEGGGEPPQGQLDTKIASLNSLQRTAEYVQQQSEVNYSQHSLHNAAPLEPTSSSMRQLTMDDDEAARRSAGPAVRQRSDDLNYGFRDSPSRSWIQT